MRDTLATLEAARDELRNLAHAMKHTTRSYQFRDEFKPSRQCVTAADGCRRCLRLELADELDRLVLEELRRR